MKNPQPNLWQSFKNWIAYMAGDSAYDYVGVFIILITLIFIIVTFVTLMILSFIHNFLLTSISLVVSFVLFFGIIKFIDYCKRTTD